VRRYLNEFLMDRRVIDKPWPLRRLIVGMILIRRPGNPRAAYPKHLDRRKARRSLSPAAKSGRSCRNASACRWTGHAYQQPSIEAPSASCGQKVDEVFLIPLFPHYAMSSYETAVVRVQKIARKVAPG